MHSDGMSCLRGKSAEPISWPVKRWPRRRPFAFSAAKSSPILACILTAITVAGCDEAFSPIAPSELQLSVFGYLDASADTQWIRVMPIRALMLTSPDSFGTVVTLEELGTGRMIELRDSTFRFSDLQNPDVGSEGTYVHDFWTTERIQPGGAYRFSARLNGEEPAEAMVEIPRDHEAEVWISQTRYMPDYLRIAGLKHLPFLSANTHFYNPCGSGVDTVWTDGSPAQEGTHLIPIETRRSITPGTCTIHTPRSAPLASSWTSRSRVGFPWCTGSTYPWNGSSPCPSGNSSCRWG